MSLNMLGIWSRSVVVLSAAILVISSCTDDEPNSPPTADDQKITIEENLAKATVITRISGRDRDGDELLYALLEGNTDQAFAISEEGLITVNNPVAIDYEVNPVFALSVLVSDGIDDISVTIDITLTDLLEVDVRDLTAEEIRVIDFFIEIALGFEFGSASQITRKWTTDMRVYVSGDTTEVLMMELNMIIEELNALITDGFQITRVMDQDDSNMHVFLGTGADYGTLYPSSRQFVAGNWGLFSVNWDADQNLNRAHMYVDTERANIMAQRHLLREEFTQSLGLAMDANTYQGSIFLASWSTTTEYLPIDKEIIRLLYHPTMVSGLDEPEARAAAAAILRAG